MDALASSHDERRLAPSTEAQRHRRAAEQKGPQLDSLQAPLPSHWFVVVVAFVAVTGWMTIINDLGRFFFGVQAHEPIIWVVWNVSEIVLNTITVLLYYCTLVVAPGSFGCFSVYLDGTLQVMA